MCYDFEQLRQLSTVVFSKEITFRVGFGMKKVLFIGKQGLAAEWDCSTVDYILEEGMVKVWKACGTCM